MIKKKKIVSQQDKSDITEFNKTQLKFWYISKKLPVVMIIDHVNCGQPEEYAIRGMYVASICLDFHYERMECTFRPSTP